MDKEERQLKVLFGTQTGCAKEVAERIAREGKRRHYKTQVISLDAYPFSQLPQEKLVIFAVSTTGQGEVPDNMKIFWRLLLQKKITSDALQGVNFAVFGLGDSSYPHFNYAAKKLFNRLVQIGATPIHRRGDGDDQHPLGLEGELDTWLEQLWKLVLERDPIPKGMDILPDNILEPPIYRILFGDERDLNSSSMQKKGNAVYDQKNPYLSTLVSNHRISSEHWEQDVRHIILDLGDSKISYEPGDVVYILPSNLPKNVSDFIELMKLDGNKVIKQFIPNDKDVPPSDLPTPCTIEHLLTRYFDITGTPKRHFFEQIRFFATADHEREKLEEFSSTTGQEDLREYCHKVHRTCIEVFQDFPSVRPPLEYLFTILPRIQARPFSISSSQKIHPKEIHLTMGVVNFKIGKRTKKGLCSNWLAVLDPKQETRIPIWVGKGVSRLPDPEKPIIMVGPGTGCAVFRSFIEERSYSLRNGTKIGKMAFFFGCRHQKHDFLHGNEWLNYVNSGVLYIFECAFSRDQPNRVYVQHLIRKRSQDLWNMIQEGAVIFVAGNARRMPIDVREAFRDVVKENGVMTEDEAEAYLRSMEKSKRYLTETWF